MNDSECEFNDTYEINLGAQWDTPGEGAYYECAERPDECQPDPAGGFDDGSDLFALAAYYDQLQRERDAVRATKE